MNNINNDNNNSNNINDNDNDHTNSGSNTPGLRYKIPVFSDPAPGKS